MIHAELLLQQQVADILFIPENLRDAAFHPFAAEFGRDAARIQFLADGEAAIAEAAEGKDQLDRFGLIRDNRDPPVIHMIPHDLCGGRYARLEFIPNAPLAVFGYGTAFFLGERSEEGKHQLSVPAGGMHILFLEENVNPEAFQLAGGFQERDSIAGEPAHGFRDDLVDLPGAAIHEQALEFGSIRPGAGAGIVGIDPGVNPEGIPLDVFAIITHLRG